MNAGKNGAMMSIMSRSLKTYPLFYAGILSFIIKKFIYCKNFNIKLKDYKLNQLFSSKFDFNNHRDHDTTFFRDCKSISEDNLQNKKFSEKVSEDFEAHVKILAEFRWK